MNILCTSLIGSGAIRAERNLSNWCAESDVCTTNRRSLDRKFIGVAESTL